MLVISRHRDESIMIGDYIVVTIADVSRDKVRLAIDAPIEIPVHRQEVYEAILRSEQEEFNNLMNAGSYVAAYINHAHKSRFEVYSKDSIRQLYEGLERSGELNEERKSKLENYLK